MTTWRWRLARLIAPAPIMRDPFPGDGVFVTIRDQGQTAHFRADRFRLKSTSRLQVREYGGKVWTGYPSHGPFTRFVGTIRG